MSLWARYVWEAWNEFVQSWCFDVNRWFMELWKRRQSVLQYDWVSSDVICRKTAGDKRFSFLRIRSISKSISNRSDQSSKSKRRIRVKNESIQWQRWDLFVFIGECSAVRCVSRSKSLMFPLESGFHSFSSLQPSLSWWWEKTCSAIWRRDFDLDGDRLCHRVRHDSLPCSNGFHLEEKQCQNVFVDHYHRDQCYHQFDLFDFSLTDLLSDREKTDRLRWDHSSEQRHSIDVWSSPSVELHKYQSKYDDSLTIKIYLFQFVNFYSSLFYIAFFKGR